MTSFESSRFDGSPSEHDAREEVGVALETASSLVSDGRWSQAIEMLSAVNRGRRDQDIERRLVRLRHDAFENLEWGTPPAWPSAVPDRCPPGSPPEVTGKELDSSKLTSSILRSGSLLVRGLIAEPSVGQLANGIEEALAAADPPPASPAGDVRGNASWFEPFQPAERYDRGILGAFLRSSGGVLAADSPRLLFELLEAVGEAGIPELVTDHLGERPALSVNKTTLRRVTKDTNAQWHQDGAFMGTDIRTVNLWLALSHCGDDAPGLDIVPRRLDHIVETGTPGSIFDWSASPAMVERAAEGTPVCRPIFEPGDALLFDHMFMHRTAASAEMTRDRYGVEMWFFAPSMYPPSQIPLLV
jgi:hypothetical protein